MNQQFAAVRPYLSQDDQLCRVRLSRLEEGSARGQRVVDVVNGSGLAFTVTPDRAMNVVECSFAGIPISFSHNGHRGLYGDWLRGWSTGMITTCGLLNAGSPSGGQGLHGNISSESAEQLSLYCRNGEVEISGLVHETMPFGANLTLDRKIKTAYGQNRLEIHDTVKNCGESTAFTEILYHCNFGFPLISPDMEMVCAEHEIVPRDDAAAAELPNWNNYPLPLEGIGEYCFRHLLPPTDGTWASFGVINRKLGIKVAIEYDTTTLPHMVQWKKPSKYDYVMGLEPTNVSLAGCEFDRENGFGKFLAPGETVDYRMRLVFDKI